MSSALREALLLLIDEGERLDALHGQRPRVSDGPSPADDIRALGQRIVALLSGERTEHVPKSVEVPDNLRRLLKSMLATYPGNRPEANVVVRVARRALETLEAQAAADAARLAQLMATPRDASSVRAVFPPIGFGALTILIATLVVFAAAFWWASDLVRVILILPASFLPIAAAVLIDRHVQKRYRELFRRGEAHVARVTGTRVKDGLLLVAYELEVGGQMHSGEARMLDNKAFAEDDQLLVLVDPETAQFHAPLRIFSVDVPDLAGKLETKGFPLLDDL